MEEFNTPLMWILLLNSQLVKVHVKDGIELVCAGASKCKLWPANKLNLQPLKDAEDFSGVLKLIQLSAV
jgi:hypothetical protein